MTPGPIAFPRRAASISISAQVHLGVSGGIDDERRPGSRAKAREMAPASAMSTSARDNAAKRDGSLRRASLKLQSELSASSKDEDHATTPRRSPR